MPGVPWDIARIASTYGVMDLRIAELLAAKGETQTQMAEALGVEQSTVSRWCSGEKRPSKKSMAQIAAYFGVHPLELFAASVLSQKERRLLALGRLLQDTDIDLIEDLAKSLRRRNGGTAE